MIVQRYQKLSNPNEYVLFSLVHADGKLAIVTSNRDAIEAFHMPFPTTNDLRNWKNENSEFREKFLNEFSNGPAPLMIKLAGDDQFKEMYKVDKTYGYYVDNTLVDNLEKVYFLRENKDGEKEAF